MKVDVMVLRKEAFDLAKGQHIKMHWFDERSVACPVACVVEMILWKMVRSHRDQTARQDEMEGDARCNDILGMLKVPGQRLNTPL